MISNTGENQGDHGKVWPFIIPGVFNGEPSVNWDEWIDHFESVLQVNEWNNDNRLLWLEVRLNGKARNAWKCLSDRMKLHYDTTKVAL